MFNINKIGTTAPVLVEKNIYPFVGFLRVNHLLLKNKSKDFFDAHTLDKLPTDVRELLSKSLNYVENPRTEVSFNFKYKYCYLTVDQGFVRKGNTLRDPGWHIDGFQGVEVPEPKPVDINFVWCDALPMEYVCGYKSTYLDFFGFDKTKHNVFNWIDRQITSKMHTRKIKPNTFYMMDSYCVHRGTEAEEDTYRRFIRLSFTEVPITSVKMTINPYIDYDYPIHTTSGNIPEHLT